MANDPKDPESKVRFKRPNTNPPPPFRPHTLRWAMENRDGITCYVYTDIRPDHFLRQGYTNVRAAGYFDHAKNVIVNPDDIDTERTPNTNEVNENGQPKPTGKKK